jgi:hypothetical protein
VSEDLEQFRSTHPVLVAELVKAKRDLEDARGHVRWLEGRLDGLVGAVAVVAVVNNREVMGAVLEWGRLS